MLYRVKSIEPRKPGYYVSLIVEDDFEHVTIKVETWYCATVAEVEKTIAEGHTPESLKELLKYQSLCGSGVYSFEQWRIVEHCADGREFLVEDAQDSSDWPAYQKEQAERQPDEYMFVPVETGLA
jgi:hypothetical protein